jgi:hypothetical protein
MTPQNFSKDPRSIDSLLLFISKIPLGHLGRMKFHDSLMTKTAVYGENSSVLLQFPIEFISNDQRSLTHPQPHKLIYAAANFIIE